MDIVCFCHLRWNFVYQRPQHLLSRFAKQSRVFIIEEPVFTDSDAYLQVSNNEENLWILVPHLKHGTGAADSLRLQQDFIGNFLKNFSVNKYIAWFYTPMMLPLASVLSKPVLTVYDCMDELSAFKFAPHDIKEREQQLLDQADVVFTGGYTLYEAKKHLHANIHPFPSSIDKAHFGSARQVASLPADYNSIPSPRMGFFGVVDERFDIELLRSLASKRSDWHFVIIGPVVKIDPAVLPHGENIHYIGGKSYNELPAHLSAWDIALIPFAINESTEFISPTKTPEYLAGGKPVVSTPIKDVVRPYGNEGLVFIGNNAEDFEKGIEAGLQIRDDPGWLERVDKFLDGISWDITWNNMMRLIEKALDETKSGNSKTRSNEYV